MSRTKKPMISANLTATENSHVILVCGDSTAGCVSADQNCIVNNLSEAYLFKSLGEANKFIRGKEKEILEWWVTYLEIDNTNS
jgi:hypothetical protein